MTLTESPCFDKIAVWENTYQYYQKTSDPEPSIKYTQLNLKPQPKYPSTKIRVLQYDIIDVALEYKRRGWKPLLLNMADISVPGGRVKDGSGAQEECCFRRSNYYKHLKEDFYPLLGSSAIYSKDVEFIKENEIKGNVPLQEPLQIDLIAIPALRFPQLDRNSDSYGQEIDRKKMEEKIEMIFQVGFKHQHQILVLSAFGCGAYGNPPREVVQIFRDKLKKWDGCFKEVTFAILGPNLNFFQELQN